MDIIANYHAHTKRCGHALGEDREYVEAAIKLGLKEIGFSDHSPIPSKFGYIDGYRVKENQAEDYFSSVKKLQEEYKNDIRIRIGVETEYFPGTDDEYLDYITSFPIEYMILGQHYLWNGNGFGACSQAGEKELTDYYENLYLAAATGNYLYIAHPDMLNYPVNDELYEKTVRNFLQRIKPLGTVLEINALGAYEGRHYPREFFWQLVKEYGNPVILGFDAHRPQAYSADYAVKAISFAEGFGFNTVKSFDDSHFTGVFRKSTER